ncbi:MAG: AsmA-like C-terminal region-containing protein [Candidatus Hydrogenedentes bacterium]|nr:AsmA-like C-terminal region-containing protein [Candidatus Hydrogenedentota bacterium]
MPSGRYTRVWLLGLLVLTAALAGAALFAKYKLEGIRGAVLDNAESRIGAQFQVSSVSAFGLRGLEVEGINVTFPTPSGMTVACRVPAAYVYVDLLDLFYGEVSIERVQLDGASITVHRPVDVPWLQRDKSDKTSSPSPASPSFPFRVMGKGCSLTIENVVGESRLTITDIDFDVSRLADSSSLAATLKGQLEGSPEKTIHLDLQYASAKDFDIKAACSQINAADVNVFLPANQHIVQDGSVSPSIRLAGRSDETIDLSIDAPFVGVAIRNQPTFMRPATGVASAIGNYDPAEKVLNLSMSSIESDQFAGTLSGKILANERLPILDLTFASSKLPIQDALETLLEGKVERYGKLEYSLDGEASFYLSARGPSDDLTIEARGVAAGGQAKFSPTNSQWPRVSLTFGRLDAAWDSKSRQPVASLAVLDGKVSQQKYDVQAEHIAGALRLNGDVVQVAPLTAVVTGQPVIASGEYNIKTKTAKGKLSGSVAGMEKTKLAESIRNTTLAGAASVNLEGAWKNNTCTFSGSVDATQASIAYRWYFLKPIGMGASAQVQGEFIPKKRFSVDVTGLVAGSEIKSISKFSHNGTRWVLRSSKATSDKLDLVSVGKCLTIPYQVENGTGTAATYEWIRDNDQTQDWHATMSCAVTDEVSVRVKGGNAPMVAKNVQFSGIMNQSGEVSAGEMTLDAKEANMPSLRSGKWFVPFERDFTKYPPTDWKWTYHLKCSSIEVPPWKGSDFVGEAYTTLNESGFTNYVANVDGGGVLSGTIKNDRNQNEYHSTNEWKQIPAHYMMEHLQLPLAFKGLMSGKMEYSQDRDDPRSRKGSGYFEMGEGQFSADFLLAMLEQQLDSQTMVLPPSLKFSQLHADVEVEKDVIRTPSIKLVSDAIRIEGSGRFVTDGDVDYNIRVAVNPDAADRIPLLHDNFNVQGHKLAQRDIELAFRLTGPTVKPKGEVTGTPPLHVTLMSGSLEAANEALRVIDAPRRILVDLLKTGGGIIGVRKPTQDGSPN